MFIKNLKKGFALTLIISITAFNNSNYCMKQDLLYSSSPAIEIKKKTKEYTRREMGFLNILNEHKTEVKRRPNFNYDSLPKEGQLRQIAPSEPNSVTTFDHFDNNYENSEINNLEENSIEHYETNSKNLARFKKLAECIAFEDKDKSKPDKEKPKSSLEKHHDNFFNQCEFPTDENNSVIDSDLPELCKTPEEPRPIAKICRRDQNINLNGESLSYEQDESPEESMKEKRSFSNCFMEPCFLDNQFNQQHPFNSQNSQEKLVEKHQQGMSKKNKEFEVILNQAFEKQELDDKKMELENKKVEQDKPTDTLEPAQTRDKAAILRYIEEIKKNRRKRPENEVPKKLKDIVKDEKNLAEDEIYSHKNLTEKQKEIFSDLSITKKEVNFILCKDNRDLLIEELHKKYKGYYEKKSLKTLGLLKKEGDLLELNKNQFYGLDYGLNTGGLSLIILAVRDYNKENIN